MSEQRGAMKPHKTVRLLLLGICWANLVAATDDRPLSVKIANDKRDVYRVPARDLLRSDVVDFRLLYVDEVLLDELVREGAILVDTTRFRTKREKMGIFKFKLTSTSVAAVFEQLIDITEFKHESFPDSILVQKLGGVMQAPKSFLIHGWENETIFPGDIIILRGP